LVMVANISNPKVKGKWNVVPDGWELEFTTEEVTAQDFSFDIMYKSETGESVLKFDARLEPEAGSIYGWYVGKYKLDPCNRTPPLANSGPQLGEQGDIFVHIYKNALGEPGAIIYAPIIINYFKGNNYLHASNIGMIDNKQSLVAAFNRILLGGNYREMDFQPGSAQIIDGVGITAYQYNFANGYEGAMEKEFCYALYWSIPYIGKDVPKNLTQAEIDLIYSKKK
jgi:hypothetical protein